MKRDDELVRTIVLKVEELGDSPNAAINNFRIDGASDEAVDYHVWLLGDAGYMRVRSFATTQRTYSIPCCLTAAGHDFANSIRDDRVWRSTMEAARESRAATLKMLGEIAKAFVRQKIKEKTGLDLID
ncbi:DUF2513 domain-containing protein [Hyphomicrobium sp. 2TAF46]|uniref:DUF2513 domain-containing protein n=1 Tax=Hyphomicrobium sp. 2TAF46 TaxID=3233019 RepID=UPI003F938043